MMDNYFRHLEKIITPKIHSIEEINKSKEKEQIIKHQQEMEKEIISNNFSATTRNQSLNNTGNFKSASVTHKISPRSDLSKSNLYATNSKNTNNTNITPNYPPDINVLREVIIEEKKKNMQLRFEVSELKNKICLFEKRELENIKSIESFKKEKEINSNYLMKMENLISNLERNKEKQKRSSRSFSVKNDFNNNNNMQLEEQKFTIKALNEEVNKFKHFKKEIFIISSTYDEMNNNILTALKDIKDLFVNLNAKLSRREKEAFDYSSIEKIKDNVEKITLIFEKSLTSKQSEFNFLLEEKERENNNLNAELISLKENFEELKKERQKDKNLIFELETKLKIKKLKLEELNRNIYPDNKMTTDASQEDRNEILKEKAKTEIIEKTRLIKDSVERSIRKMSRKLDLQKYENVRLIESIKYRLNN